MHRPKVLVCGVDDWILLGKDKVTTGQGRESSLVFCHMVTRCSVVSQAENKGRNRHLASRRPGILELWMAAVASSCLLRSARLHPIH